MATAGALSGLRVLDLTVGLAGPSATRILAGLGADVIKIEMTGEGEFTRQVVPFVFRSHNRDKRSLAVDLRKPEGVDVVRRLAATSDVFVQSQRPGFVESVHLGEDDLAAVNPRLICASLSGFGTEGPDAQRRCVDMLAQAESGMAIAQSGLIGNLSFIDSAAGLSLANGILAALLQRSITGTVQHVRSSLLDTAIYLQAAPIAEFSANGTSIDQTSYWERYATVGLFESADGPLYMAAYWNQDWEVLCTLLDRPDLLTDDRYASTKARAERSREVRDILNKGFATHSRAELIGTLQTNGIMAGEVRTYSDVLASPQVRANQPFVTEVDESGTRTLFARPAFRLSSDAEFASRPAPAVGDATVEILREIGMSDSELGMLIGSGVVSTQSREIPS